MRVYFAGPDVFRPDHCSWAEGVRRRCTELQLTALIPSDCDLGAAEICRLNLEMVGRSDVVLANLMPFRGTEPDSGTVFEAAYAHARGKRVIGYLAAPEPLTQRVARLWGPLSRHEQGWQCRDRDGWGVEDMGRTLNLMLAETLELVQGDVFDALQRLAPTALARRP